MIRDCKNCGEAFDATTRNQRCCVDCRYLGPEDKKKRKLYRTKRVNPKQ